MEPARYGFAKLLTALLGLLSPPLVGCQAACPSDPALQILCRLHTTAIPPDEYSWVRVADANPGRKCKVFWFSGGPGSELPDGAIGCFDSRGRLMTAKHVDHLEGLVNKTSILRNNDSLMFIMLDGKGTGLRDESIVVLTLWKGEWVETFRCPGNYYSEGFGDVCNRNVTLRLERTPQNGRGRLNREVVESQYPSNEAYEAGKPSGIKRSGESYTFDSAKMAFIEVGVIGIKSTPNAHGLMAAQVSLGL